MDTFADTAISAQSIGPIWGYSEPVWEDAVDCGLSMPYAAKHYPAAAKVARLDWV